MVKILNTSLNSMFRNSDQFRDSSHFLMKADDPPLEELDPAILSCGLPAIILSEVEPMYAPPIRYTIDQLLSLRKSALCTRRPLAADDPKVAPFAIWRNPSQPNRRGKAHAGNSRKDDKDKGACDSTGSKGQTPERDDKPRNPARHENGFIGPRFRQNYEFSNRNHHVIVRSYRGDSDNYQMQNNSLVENEPEWMSAGPTSRMDTIELRGFDDDLSNHDSSSVSQSSWGKATGGDSSKNSSKNSSGKQTSFYDDLHHYEHVVNPKRNDIFLKPPHDSYGRENDVESVTTSNTGSPPPARSTPTKHMADGNNSAEHSGVNVTNFEKFMKFDSLLGSDSAARSSTQSGSRSSKWFRHGSNQPGDSNHDRRQHSFNMTQDSFAGNGNYNRYPFDRSFPQHYQFRNSSSYNNYQVDSQNNPPQGDPHSAYKRVMDMIAQCRTNNNQTAQEQYMLQMLNKTQQSEILRRMLIRNTGDNGSDGNQQQQQQHQAPQPPRIPSQLELQLHTQSIMQNALLRKKLQDQRRVLLEQNSHLSAMATPPNMAEPNAEVQQFVKSVSPNFQRSLSVLNQTAAAGAGHYRSFNQSFPGAATSSAAVNNPLFLGGTSQLDLSESLRQMLLPQHQQGGPRPFGNRRRSGKKSVTWKNPI